MTISFAATIPPEKIRHAVWLYRSTLSYRDVETLLAEAVASREIPRRRVLKFGSVFAGELVR
jgi:transposase-like protein